MSQHDYDIANQTRSSLRADVNLALLAIVSQNSGATEPASKYAYMLWADTTTGLLKQRNSGNTGWIIRGTIAEARIVARASNTILGVGDFGKTFIATGTWAQTLTAAATLADGWMCYYKNDGSGVITFDPNASETIDGVATLALAPGEGCLIFCDGANFKTIGRSGTLIQNQTATAFTTGGTSTAYTLTPLPATAALAANQRYRVTFHTAAGATPTLAVSSLTAKSLKYKDSSGAKQAVTAAHIPTGWVSDVEYDGTDYVVLQPAALPVPQIFPVTASVAANALTLTLNPCAIDFRSSTLASGVVNTRPVPSAISVTVSSGSTLGTTNGVAARLTIIALDNAGTVELAVVNLAGGNNLDETTLISTTAEGGAGGADSASVIYSTTARTNVPFRVVGFIDITEATAGTWASAPTTIQGVGGQALTALQSVGYGQTWQDVKTTPGRTSGTLYTNTTGRPIMVRATTTNSGSGNYINSEVNGVTIDSIQNNAPYGINLMTAFIVPPGQTYKVTIGVGALQTWFELR